MGNNVILKTASDTKCNVVFCDFFDTVVHRTVHPNYVLRLWAKQMIRELGLSVTIDELYFIRKESEQYLAKLLNKKPVELLYHQVITEVYNRLACSTTLELVSLEIFTEYFELSDCHAETKVQYLNTSAIESLQLLKENNLKIYCVSDFYVSSPVLRKIMAHHGIESIFDDVFVSCEYDASKQEGTLYKKLLQELAISPESALMIGDNLKSDILNAEAAGMSTLHIPNTKFSRTNLKSAIGSDKRDYRRILKKLYRECNRKTAPPNSDYILFYTVYIERLYAHAKKNGIKDLLFLSREGLYLKKLFDHYQDQQSLDKANTIKSHYLRTSRQASMLVSLKNIDEEPFTFLRLKYPDLSLYTFLKNFNLSEKTMGTIHDDLGVIYGERTTIKDFFDSDIFNRLVKNDVFRKVYEIKRWEQKDAFELYLKSFNIDFHSEGMHIADIGWGGSMQERLYDYFEGKVKVFGYYLGIREIYTISTNTKRFGLNFTVFPYPTYSDNILRGNIELNEQLLSAPHGSVISYNVNNETLTDEFHYEDEKKIFEDHILEIQDFMFEKFKELINRLNRICYSDTIVQNEMTDYALRIGLFASKRKIASAMKISEGFYTNVGDFSQGLTIGTSKNSKSILKEVKPLLLSPDKMFRYILRVKPFLYTRNKYFLAYIVPFFLLYGYIKLNIWFRRTILLNNSYLKYAYLK